MLAASSSRSVLPPPRPLAHHAAEQKMQLIIAARDKGFHYAWPLAHPSKGRANEPNNVIPAISLAEKRALLLQERNAKLGNVDIIDLTTTTDNDDSTCNSCNSYNNIVVPPKPTLPFIKEIATMFEAAKASGDIPDVD